jgi:hypothetical protein
MPLTKPWQDATPENLGRAPAALGVYEIGDAHGTLLYIGFAGGRSRYGLRGEITNRIGRDDPNAADAGGTKFRYEVNQMYLTRYVELLEREVKASGSLPPRNLLPGEYIPSTVRRAHVANGHGAQGA